MTHGRRRPPQTRPDADLIDLTVSEIGAQGDGVARYGGADIFVPYTLPGDRVLARRVGFHHAIPDSWKSRTAAHRKPPCTHFGTCGGCALQHMQDTAYAEWKVHQLKVALAQRGFTDVEIAPLVVSAPGERRRADFGAIRSGARVDVGFRAYKSWQLIDLQTCSVLTPRIVTLLPALRSLALVLLPDRGTANLHTTQTETGLDLLIECAGSPDQRQREALATFATSHDIARIAWRQATETPEIMIQRRVPQVIFADTMVDLSPGAFLQASKSGETAIVSSVLDGVGVGVKRRIADLYSGCGTLTFQLARKARVHAVEGAKELAAALEAAARRAGQAGRVTVETRDLSRRPLLAAELADYGAIVFDPPRDGAAFQAAEIGRSRVPIVVGVSCNPATFIRDARILTTAGYRLTRITPVDQFLWSPHLELVGVFKR